MVRKILPSLLLVFMSASFADVNSDIQKCLTQSSTSAGSKAQCVQAAINKALTDPKSGQIQALYSTYTTFATNDFNQMSGGGGGGAGGTPTGAPSAAAAPSPRPGAASPSASAPPSAAPANPAPPPPPISQPTPPPASAPSNQGGIKYY